MNRVTLAGRLGGDPEVKYSAGGNAVANFSLALSESRKSGDGWEKYTTWIRLTLFGKNAENAGKVLRKGDSVSVEARLSNNSWTDKDGNKRSNLDVLVDRWELLGRSNGDKDQEAQQEEYNF